MIRRGSFVVVTAIGVVCVGVGFFSAWFFQSARCADVLETYKQAMLRAHRIAADVDVQALELLERGDAASASRILDVQLDLEILGMSEGHVPPKSNRDVAMCQLASIRKYYDNHRTKLVDDGDNLSRLTHRTVEAFPKSLPNSGEETCAKAVF